MSRTQQKLINYHSLNQNSARTDFNVANLDYGEIAVRNNAAQPELYIKTSETTYAVFLDSATTQTMISEAIAGVNTQITEQIENISGGLVTLSSTVVSDYATIDYANSASANAYTAATAYTKTVSGNIETHLHENYATSSDTKAEIDSVKETVSSLDTEFREFSGIVESDYALKSEVENASGNAYTAATAYTKTVSGNIETHLLNNYATSADTKAEIDSVKETVSQNITDISYVSGQVTNLSAGTIALISDKLSNVYVYKGSVPEYANLSAFTDSATVGDVYNVVASQGNPGDATYVPAGTNYAWNGTEWDALGGSVNLSNYTTTATTQDLRNTLTQVRTDLDNFSGYVETNYATTSYVDTASGNAYTAATAYTDTVSGDIRTHLINNYATSADTVAAINAVSTAATSIEQGLEELSGHVQTHTDTLAESALQRFKLSGDGASAGENENETIQSGAKASYTSGGDAELDLSALIIDCGDF